MDKCPKCKIEMIRDDHYQKFNRDHIKYIKCPKCGYRSYLILFKNATMIERVKCGICQNLFDKTDRTFSLIVKGIKYYVCKDCHHKQFIKVLSKEVKKND